VELEGSKKKSDDKSFRWHGKKPPQTRRAVEPEFIAPELATLVDEVPEGARWLHEVKYDGYRIIARKSGEEVALFSRSGLDWTVRFPAIAKALSSLPCNSALLDGEIAFVLPSGLTSFKSLQEHIDTAHPAFRYFLFDLLSLDGKDWRGKPLLKRKERLQALMSEKKLPGWLVYSDHMQGSGSEFYQQACDAGLREWRADLCRQGRHRIFQRRPFQSRQALQAARAEAVVLCRGAGDRAQGRGVA
jgi:bifunctional non-homologous end joining protein LigD